MSYVREVLQPGEEIRFRTNIHWFVYLPAIVMFIVGLAFALWHTATGSQHLMLLILSGLSALTSVLLFMPAWLKRFGTEIAGADTISAEFLVAGNASLVIDAGDGNDTVTGGHRNDLLIGGLGVDTARFTGARADYQVVSIGSDIQVTDLRSGSPDGTDRFQAFETFAFSNASFDPSSVLLNPANLPPNNIVAGPLAVN